MPLPDGFINIDKYYYPGSEHPGMNLEDGKTWNLEHPDSPWDYGDAVYLSQFHDNEFDLVLMVHVLEHLSMNDGNQALKAAVKVLKPGGILEVEVPDLMRACHLYLHTPFSETENNADWFRVMGLLYGTQGAEGEGQFHLCGYSREYLKFRLKEQGLEQIEEIPVGFGHGTREGVGKPEPQFDFRLRGTKKR